MTFRSHTGSAGPGRFLTIGTFVWSAIAVGSTAHAASQEPAEYVPGRVIVRFQTGTAAQREDEILQDAGAFRRGRIAQIDAQLLEVPLVVDETATIRKLLEQPEVASAELNRVVHVAGVTPNDQ